MKHTGTITYFTVKELLGFRVTRTLLALSALLPLLAWIFSGLFMLETTKVELDVMIGGAYLLGIIFLLSTVVTLLGNDIGERVCFFFLSPPMQRPGYILGRFFGSILVLTLLFLVLLIGIEILIAMSIESESEAHRHGIEWLTGIVIVWTAWYQTISLMGVVFLICAWASGVAEMLVFSSSAAFIYWVFPPIMAAVKAKNDIDHLVSDSLRTSIEGLSWLLPDMTGGSIVLAFEHGLPVSPVMMLQHAAGHLGYAAIMIAAALFVFSRRNL